MPVYSQQQQQEQPVVIQNNQYIIDSSSTAPGSYFAQSQAVAPASGGNNEVNITNINIDASANSVMNNNNTQYTQIDSSATYTDNSMASTAISTTDITGINNATAADYYSTAPSTNYCATAPLADYNTAATDYNVAATTNADFQMETATYMATDNTTTMYSNQDLGASETVQGTDDWAVAATASVTVDYSGGDWGGDWY
ncbi:hypothetical protein PG990_013759 [Apiospora arundinis]